MAVLRPFLPPEQKAGGSNPAPTYHSAAWAVNPVLETFSKFYAP